MRSAVRPVTRVSAHIAHQSKSGTTRQRRRSSNSAAGRAADDAVVDAGLARGRARRAWPARRGRRGAGPTQQLPVATAGGTAGSRAGRGRRSCSAASTMRLVGSPAASAATGASSSGVGGRASRTTRRRRPPRSPPPARHAACGAGPGRAVPRADRRSASRWPSRPRGGGRGVSTGRLGDDARGSSGGVSVLVEPGEQQRGRAANAPAAPRGCPASSDPAVVDHDDAVGEPQRRTPVGDEDRRAARHQLAQRRVDLLLDAGVDRRRGVVEDQDARVGEQGAGERDAAGAGRPTASARARRPTVS